LVKILILKHPLVLLHKTWTYFNNNKKRSQSLYSYQNFAVYLYWNLEQILLQNCYNFWGICLFNFMEI